MISIELQYQPIGLLPWKRTIKGRFPVQYSELNQKQFLAITSMGEGKTDDVTFLSLMTGFSKKLIRKLGKWQQYKLFQIFEGFGIDQPHNAFIIHTIRTGGKTFLSPAPKLKGMTFGQFIFAGSLHENWAKSRTNEDLCRFVASIYLLQNEVFDENSIEPRAALLAKVNETTLDAIATNWRLIGEWLAKAYPLVFVKAEPGEKVKQVNNGWIKIFDSLVGEDIVNSDRYSKLPVNNVFRYMSERIKQNMKRKK